MGSMKPWKYRKIEVDKRQRTKGGYQCFSPCRFSSFLCIRLAGRTALTFGAEQTDFLKKSGVLPTEDVHKYEW